MLEALTPCQKMNLQHNLRNLHEVIAPFVTSLISLCFYLRGIITLLQIMAC